MLFFLPIVTCFLLFTEWIIYNNKRRRRQAQKLNMSAVKCNACGKESESLKKCPCGSVRYCDRTCQKSHWRVHKVECKQSSASEASRSEASKSEDARSALKVAMEELRAKGVLHFGTLVEALMNVHAKLLCYLTPTHLEPLETIGKMFDELAKYVVTDRDMEEAIVLPGIFQRMIQSQLDGLLPPVLHLCCNHVQGALNRRGVYSRLSADLGFFRYLLDKVSRQHTIVDAGAGNGLWTAIYMRLGYNVIAFDPYPKDDEYNTCATYAKVEQCTHEFLKTMDTKQCVLSIGWPGNATNGGQWAAEAVQGFQGPFLILHGEYRGSTGTPELFDHVDKHWKLERQFDLPRFPFATAKAQKTIDDFNGGKHVPMYSMDAIFFYVRVD
jgi:hypothetical protein